MEIPVFDQQTLLEKLASKSDAYLEQYFAMYSSWYGGIVTDPRWMQLPIDDHIVHRGDGVFEAFKAKGRKIYQLSEHLERLKRSSGSIGIELPHSDDEVREVILRTAQSAGCDDCLFRLYVSRGPGGFSTNPFETTGAQLYVVVTRLKELSESKYQQGVKAAKSGVPIKDPWLAQIKSCNYLPNVMMKKESIERGVDFTVSFDSDNCLGEGSTENMVIVDQQDRLLFPPLNKILRGTTMMRVAELAKTLKSEGLLSEISESTISYEQVVGAKEVFLLGTTIDALPVTEFDGQPIADGQVGAVSDRCLQFLREDMASNQSFLTAF